GQRRAVRAFVDERIGPGATVKRAGERGSVADDQAIVPRLAVDRYGGRETAFQPPDQDGVVPIPGVDGQRAGRIAEGEALESSRAVAVDRREGVVGDGGAGCR